MNRVFKGLKKPNTFWLVSAQVEAQAGQGTGSCMPPPKLEIALYS